MKKTTESSGNPKLPALGGVSKSMEKILLRALSEDEIAKREELKAPYFEAEERLRLLRVVSVNYDEFNRFCLKSLERSTLHSLNDMTEADRLIMNYLNSAYGMMEHFTRFLEGRCVKEDLDRYKSFVRKLQQEFFPFAFFQDFRNYVQHRGLPVGRFFTERSIHDAPVLSLSYDVEALLKSYDKWNKSKLKERAGQTLDLRELLTAYHQVLMQHYIRAMFHHLLPNGVIELDALHELLSAEVKKQLGDGFTPYIFTDIQQVGKDFKWEVQPIDVNLLAQLGIKLEKADDK